MIENENKVWISNKFVDTHKTEEPERKIAYSKKKQQNTVCWVTKYIWFRWVMNLSSTGIAFPRANNYKIQRFYLKRWFNNRTNIRNWNECYDLNELCLTSTHEDAIERHWHQHRPIAYSIFRNKVLNIYTRMSHLLINYAQILCIKMDE